MTPKAYLEYVKSLVEHAEEEGDVIITGHITGNLNIGQSSVDGAVALKPEISFPSHAFKGEEGCVKELTNAKMVFSKTIGISKDSLSDECLENIIDVEKEELSTTPTEEGEAL